MDESSEFINDSLGDVIFLLEREIARLKESLETFRMTNHECKQEMIRWHIRTLDERQDTLEELKKLAEQDSVSVH